jgi:hypothetical protein
LGSPVKIPRHVLATPASTGKFKGYTQSFPGRSGLSSPFGGKRMAAGEPIDRSQRFLSVAAVDMQNNETGRSQRDE